MKKAYILLYILFGYFTANATNYVVSGAGSNEVNGTYVENGTYNGKPKYTFNNLDDGFIYAIIWDCYDECYNWHIMNWDRNDSYYVTSAAESSTPPSANWRMSYMGDNVVPSVEIEGLNLSFSTSTFSENSQNDGSISNSITITHNNYGGATFTGSNGEDFIGLDYATITNLPSGLIATLVRTSSTSLILTLKGNASSHGTNIANLTLTFSDDAFSGGVASDVSNYIKNNLIISFFREISVASSGADYSTIQAAINAADDDDIISLSAETFTEHIEINKQITIKGKGIDKTIIQGSASYNTASDRVVWVYTNHNTEIVTFSNLTIRYGKTVNNNDWGAGIASYTPLVLNYCKISQNICALTGGDARGAGVYGAHGGITMEGCIISDNVCTNTNGGAYGAGVGAWDLSLTAKNCTFTNNTCSSNNSSTAEQGAGLWTTVITNLTNCTFTNNTAYKGAGIFFKNNVATFKNVISYGNTGTVGADLYRLVEFVGWSAILNASNCIIGTTSSNNGSTINGTDVSNSSSNPLFNTLADNGGYSYTYSLQAGSPAIDAGITDSDVLAFDQRGYLTNGTKDIGAYEYNGLGRSWKGTTNTDWATASNWFENSIPTSATNVIISDQVNDVIIASSTLAVCNDLYVYSGATLTNNTTVGDGGSLTVYGDFTNNGIVSSGGTSTIIFNGTSMQTIDGVNNSTFQNFTVNNSNGVSITTAPTINGELTFSSGNIIASSQDNPVILETSSSVSGAANNKCIVGYCQLNTNSTNKYTFPIGTSSSLRTASVIPTSNSATSYIANYINSSYGSFTYSQVNGTIDHSVATEYWDINRISGAANCYIELSYDANTGADNNYSDFIVAHYTSNAWESTGNATVAGDATTGTVVTTVAVSSFSPFTRGSKSVSAPLPVDLINFQAICNSDEVKLSWSTAMELNNDYFSVEKSDNGLDFSAIAKVKGRGTSSSLSNYNYIDINNDQKGGYYRLIQNDFDGKKTISSIISSNCTESNKVIVSPNPSNGIVTINGISESTDVEIYNSIGKLLLTKNINLDSNQLDLTSLNNGVYLFKTSNSNSQFSRIVINK